MAGVIPTARAQAIKSGVKTYIDGTPCPVGHVGPRYTSNGTCTECTAARNKARLKKNAAQEPADMTLSQHWQYISPYRYAATYQGHTMQTIPNPDREDKRRYMSVIDGKPIDNPSHTLNEAKTKAIKAVQRMYTAKAANKLFGADKRPTAQAEPFSAPIAADPADGLLDDLPPADPAPVETRAPQPEPEPAPAVRPAPAPNLPVVQTGPDRVIATFTIEIMGGDYLSAMNALQAAKDLLADLPNLGAVTCAVTNNLPPQIRL